MDELFLKKVLELSSKNDWKNLIELNKKSDNKNALKISWIWPDIDDIEFIKNIILGFNLDGISSIGCGSGLFEWILKNAAGIPIKGYEINEEWWNSKYSCPNFIKLNYITFPTKDLNPNFALMFCYFNNKEAFHEYVKYYSGNMIIIIGPAYGKGIHTDPLPFEPNFYKENEWILYSYKEIKNTKDFIAIYIRNKEIIM